MKGKVGSPSSKKTDPGASNNNDNVLSPSKRASSKRDLSKLTKPKKSFNPFKSSPKMVSFESVQLESPKSILQKSQVEPIDSFPTNTTPSTIAAVPTTTTNTELISAQIVSTAMANAALQIKRQTQKKCIKSDARAMAWKCIANAALGISA